MCLDILPRGVHDVFIKDREESFMKIYTSVEQLIGNTPLLEPLCFNRTQTPGAKLLLKLEGFIMKL